MLVFVAYMLNVPSCRGVRAYALSRLCAFDAVGMVRDLGYEPQTGDQNQYNDE